MHRSLIHTGLGLLVVLASACGSDATASPPNTQGAPTSEAPDESDPPEPEPPTTEPRTEPTTPVTEPPTTVKPTPPTTVKPTPTPVPNPTVPPTQPPPTQPPPTQPPPTQPPPTQPPPSNGAACLVGDWVIGDAELASYFDTVRVGSGFESIDSTGVVKVSFTDTRFEWAVDYQLDLTIGGATYESETSGALTGTYRAANGVVNGNVERDTRTGTVTLNGQPVADVGDLFVGINPARPIDALAFSCDGPMLTLDAGPIAGTRHTVRLTTV